MEKKTTTPIRTALTGLILATVGAFGAAHSQTLSSFEFESNNYSTSPINGTCNQNTQKVLHRDDSSIVIFNPSLGNSRANFTLMRRGSVYGQTSKMPAEYTINDFDILNDTVYFCGRHDVEGDTLSRGFIGYVAIDDLFSQSGGNCTYSDIRSTTNIQKVLAYHNESGEIVAAVFGTQFYGDAYYVSEPQSEFVDTIQGPELPIQPGFKFMNKQNIGDNHPATKISPYEQLVGWHTRSKEYWNCFAALTVTNIASATPDHKYDIWRFHYKQRVEVTRDMCLTDNHICIVSSYYNENFGCPPRNEFMIHRIDKNDFSNHITNEMTGAYFASSTTFDLLKTTCVGEDNIALCYSGITPLENGNVVYKINLSTDIFTCSLAHSLDAGCSLKPHVWDLLWVKDHNVLFVLKENGYNYPATDEVWYVSMNPYINMPYNAEVLRLHPEHFGLDEHIRFASLDEREPKFFMLVGNHDNEMLVSEKYTFGFDSKNLCNVINNSEIRQENYPTFRADSLMKHCQFVYTIGSGLNTHTNVINLPDASPTDTFPFGDVEEMKRYPMCTSDGMDFYYKEPIER